MATVRGPVSIADVRLRTTQRLLGTLDFLRESNRAFSLGEVPSGLADGAFFVTVAGGVSLGTWRVNDANGADWQSDVEVTVANRLGPHRSVRDHDSVLRRGHRILNSLVRQTEEWPVDIRFRGDGNSIRVAPDGSGNFLILSVGCIARHVLSITEAA